MTRKCYFVSDLHLLANRSNGHRHFDRITWRARRATHFVFGGDTFDFRWATTRTLEEAYNAAVLWLADLTSGCPGCHFHVVLGNHDYHQGFIDRIEVLERDVANLSWHRFYYRLGNTVFLHGDVADRKMTAEMLTERRERAHGRKKRGRVASRMYDMAIAARLHKPLPKLAYRKWLVARRILTYLDDVGQGPLEGVRHVYFGHTHSAMSGYRYGGLIFHNGGTPIKGMKFRILEANVAD